MPPVPSGFLFADPQLFNYLAVAVDIDAGEISQQLAAVADHLEKAATRVMILIVLLQMQRQVVDTRREKRDLHLRRSGIGGVELILRYDLLFLILEHFSPL